MSPGEIVAVIRVAFGEEAEKWRIEQEHRRGGVDQTYRVFRAGYRDGALPEFETADPINQSLVFYRDKSRAEANKIIADAAWIAAVGALSVERTKMEPHLMKKSEFAHLMLGAMMLFVGAWWSGGWPSLLMAIGGFIVFCTAMIDIHRGIKNAPFPTETQDRTGK